MTDAAYWIARARWASVFGYPAKEAYARRKIKQFAAQTASVDTLPEGGDAKQGSVRSKGSAVAKPDAQDPC